MLTRTTLVPGVPFTTTQNSVLRLAEDNGRDFTVLLGPYPFNGTPGQVVTHNTEATIEVVAGFVITIGKQPAVMVRTGSGSSNGTHFMVWADTASDLYFVESAATEFPVNVTPKVAGAFQPFSLSTGQYAEVFVDGRPPVVGSYFDPKTPAKGLSTTNPRLIDFVTYARSRGVAAGLFGQGEFYLGTYEAGIPTSQND